MTLPTGGTIIAGVDEAGRGALSGPVVAGAVVMNVPLFRRRRSFPCWSPFSRARDEDCLFADSKALSPEERERSYKWIAGHCAFGVGIVDATIIDDIGILKATERAMRLAVGALSERMPPDMLLVDGRDAFSFEYPHRSIIRGDRTEACIAAASIVAKVTRDTLMINAHALYPQYGFAFHKGYGSEEHRMRILEYGPCVMHRRSFLKNLLHEQLSF